MLNKIFFTAMIASAPLIHAMEMQYIDSQLSQRNVGQKMSEHQDNQYNSNDKNGKLHSTNGSDSTNNSAKKTNENTSSKKSKKAPYKPLWEYHGGFGYPLF